MVDNVIYRVFIILVLLHDKHLFFVPYPQLF